MSLIANKMDMFVVIVEQNLVTWITAASEIRHELVDDGALVMTPNETWHITRAAFSKLGRPCQVITVYTVLGSENIVQEWRVEDMVDEKYDADSNGD